VLQYKKLLKHCAEGLNSEQANHNYGGMAVICVGQVTGKCSLCLSIYQILLFRLFLSTEQSSKTQLSPEVSEKVPKMQLRHGRLKMSILFYI
jgi:hypothetical protein